MPASLVWWWDSKNSSSCELIEQVRLAYWPSLRRQTLSSRLAGLGVSFTSICFGTP